MIEKTILLVCDKCGNKKDTGCSIMKFARRLGEDTDWKFYRDGKVSCDECVAKQRFARSMWRLNP